MKQIILSCCCLLAICLQAKAQLSEKVYQTSYRIDPAKRGELSVEIDNLSFFKDNEYSGTMMKGYTLPGFWLQPKVVYYPLENIKLELGAHLLRYWGANEYPCASYRDIAYWKGDQYQKGFHTLPWFRAQMAVSEHVDIILGNLYGAANHRLIEPLYNPELNQTADPEAGVQILYTSRLIDFDIWGSWDSFIFRNDTHQEAFTFGISTQFKWNDPQSTWHPYTHVQVLAQHRGGEIDTITNNSVQTLMNGAVGFGTIWNTRTAHLRRIGAEANLLGYYQQAGHLWPFDQGYGVYARIYADVDDFRFKAGYLWCDDFIPMFGSPFFGAISTKNWGTVYQQPQLLHWGVEYSRKFGEYFSLGADVDIYHHIHRSSVDEQGIWNGRDFATSFSAGVYMRINPSFLIRKFTKN